MFSSVRPGPAPPLASLSSVSLPLFRSGRGLGLCLLLPLPGDGLAAPSRRGSCPASPPWATPSFCASAPAGAVIRFHRAVPLSIVSVTLLPLDRH
eukprot:scaffold3311_cov40-Phaeocystis_antarctica.AAC.1